MILKRFILIVSLVLVTNSSYSLKLDRVILSTDTNKMYFDFWPIVAPVWQKLVHVKPTLALIAKADVQIDQSLGDIIRFEPLPDVPDWFYAQVVRLLLPAYYGNDVCLIADIDMLPLNGQYFIDNIVDFTNDKFVVYRDQANPDDKYPMCYVAAKGSIFKEMFQINDLADIPNIVRAWYGHGYGWITDETMLLKYSNDWHQITNNVVKLGHDTLPRIDREAWKYNMSLLRLGYYIDAHMLRPYDQHKTKIDQLIKDLGC